MNYNYQIIDEDRGASNHRRVALSIFLALGTSATILGCYANGFGVNGINNITDQSENSMQMEALLELVSDSRTMSFDEFDKASDPVLPSSGYKGFKISQSEPCGVCSKALPTIDSQIKWTCWAKWHAGQLSLMDDTQTQHKLGISIGGKPYEMWKQSNPDYFHDASLDPQSYTNEYAEDCGLVVNTKHTLLQANLVLEEESDPSLLPWAPPEGMELGSFIRQITETL